MSEIINADKLIAKLHRLSDSRTVTDIVLTAVNGGGKMVQGEARLLAPVNSGELRNEGIQVKAEAKSIGEAIAVVYVTKEYGIYVELGTGPVGQANHSGISSEISVSYRSTPWYVHESQIDVGPYHFQKVGEFYKMYGQPAQPYLYPALKNNEKRVSQYICTYVNKRIKEIVK